MIYRIDSVKVEASFCNQSQIDYIEQHSHYKDIEISDFTIKEKFIAE